MKRCIVFLMLLSSIAISSIEAAEWYKLKEGEGYVADFSLSAGQSKDIALDSAVPIKVGFMTDASFGKDSFKLYKELSDKYNKKVIKLTEKNTGSSLTTITGGAIKCDPTGGKIDIEISNLTDREFKVVVYRKNLKQ